MLIFKIVAGIVIAFAIIITLGIVVFYLSKIITCGMDEYRERRNKNGKQN